jgi:hypothetical protein
MAKTAPDLFEKCAQALRSRIPIVGSRKARAAVAQLAAHRETEKGLRLLAEAAGHRDAATRAAAGRLLADIGSQAGQALVCAVWVKERTPVLGQVIEQCRYRAAQPVEVEVLSHLKAGYALEDYGAAQVQALFQALADKDPTVAENARRTLHTLERGAAQNAICLLAAREPESAAATLARERGYRPSDPGDDAVYLIATGQVERHFQEHDGVGDLRAGYGRAEPKVQARVAAAARSGDARLVEFLLQKRRSLQECTPEELKEAIAASVQRKDWPRLFADCRLMPLAQALAGWEALAASGWTPPDGQDAALLGLIRTELSGEEGPLPPPKAPPGTSAVFERWIQEGRKSAASRGGEAAILENLKNAPPQESVALVAALSAQGKPSPAARQAISSHPDWLVRLAGHLTGVTVQEGLQSAAGRDDNYWIRELAGVDGVWTFWPQTATPETLRELEAVPREALRGAAGRPRRLLRAIIAHGITGVELEKFTVAATEGAIELERHTPQIERTTRQPKKQP